MLRALARVFGAWPGGSVNRYMFRILNMLQKPDIWPLAVRHRLLRFAGVKIGRRAVVMAGCDFLQGQIAIGDDAFLNRGCLIDGAGGIAIEAHVRIGHRTMLITSTHEIGGDVRRAGRSFAQPIVVGAGCWIGAGCLVLPGVTIGERSIIAAGAVVTRAVDADRLHAGVPARYQRNLG